MQFPFRIREETSFLIQNLDLTCREADRFEWSIKITQRVRATLKGASPD